MVLSEETMAAYPECAARNSYCIHFVFLDVVVHGAPVYIDDLRSARNPHDLDVFTTPRTPDFVPENQRLGHTHDALAERQLPCSFNHTIAALL